MNSLYCPIKQLAIGMSAERVLYIVCLLSCREIYLGDLLGKGSDFMVKLCF